MSLFSSANTFIGTPQAGITNQNIQENHMLWCQTTKSQVRNGATNSVTDLLFEMVHKHWHMGLDAITNIKQTANTQDICAKHINIFADDECALFHALIRQKPTRNHMRHLHRFSNQLLVFPHKMHRSQEAVPFCPYLIDDEGTSKNLFGAHYPIIPAQTSYLSWCRQRKDSVCCDTCNFGLVASRGLRTITWTYAGQICDPSRSYSIWHLDVRLHQGAKHNGLAYIDALRRCATQNKATLNVP